jgi:hypothetical protein
VPHPGWPLRMVPVRSPHLRNLAQCLEQVAPGDEHPVPATQPAVLTGTEERDAGDRREQALGEATVLLTRSTFSSVLSDSTSAYTSA